MLLAENLNDVWLCLSAGTISQMIKLVPCEGGLWFCGKNSVQGHTVKPSWVSKPHAPNSFISHKAGVLISFSFLSFLFVSFLLSFLFFSESGSYFVIQGGVQ